MAAAVEFDHAAAATYLANLGGPGTVVHGPDGILPNGDPFGTGWISSAGHTTCGLLEQHEARAAERDGYQCPSCHWRADGCSCARCVDADPCEHFWLDDIRNVRGADILAALGMERGEVDVVIGGPPCQGFSTAGKQDVMDPRNSLVFEFGRLVREIAPKTFVMENVPPIVKMLTPEGVPVIDALCRQLSDGGYGDYQALRKGLLSQAGAGVGTPYKPGKRDVDEADADEDVQLDLFAGAES